MEEDARISIEEGLLQLGIAYDEKKLANIVVYVNELDRWNGRMNLVGLRGAPSIVRELIYDAFFLHTCLGHGRRILEIGSGAGVVAIPLSILNRERMVISVDKELKKVQFQRHVRRLLELDNLEILHGRVENMAPLEADILLAKAFGSTRDILAKARVHLRQGACAMLAKGRSERPALGEGFLPEDARRYRLPESDKEYQLFVYKKVS